MLRPQFEVVDLNLVAFMGDLLDIVLELLSLVQREEQDLRPGELLPQALILLDKSTRVILILFSRLLHRANLLILLDDLSLQNIALVDLHVILFVDSCLLPPREHDHVPQFVHLTVVH